MKHASSKAVVVKVEIDGELDENRRFKPVWSVTTAEERARL